MTLNNWFICLKFQLFLLHSAFEIVVEKLHTRFLSSAIERSLSNLRSLIKVFHYCVILQEVNLQIMVMEVLILRKY